MPKSVTMTRPRVPSSRMLSGLMSRWMTESAWAALSASAVSFMMRRTSSAGSLPRRLIRPADRLAVDVAHDEVDEALALADGVDRDDVRMGQPGGGLRLAGEALADVLLEGELGRQHLDGDPALEPLVAGAVDHAHAAAADLALDGIRVAQRLGEARRAAAYRPSRSSACRLWATASRGEKLRSVGTAEHGRQSVPGPARQLAGNLTRRRRPPRIASRKPARDPRLARARRSRRLAWRRCTSRAVKLAASAVNLRQLLPSRL